jgi:hypothetical protein
MAFASKKLQVTFSLANGSFSGGGNSHTVNDGRVLAHITVTGGPAMSNAELAIFGMPLEVMNQLSVCGNQYLKQYKNGVSVYAGDDMIGMTLVFTGDIVTAYVDAQSMPQVCFRVVAAPGTYWASKPADPISVAGKADAASLMQQIAGKMGMAFENAGVNVQLANPYYAGTLWTQMLQIARHGGFSVIVDKNRMAIVPPGQSRASGAVLISPQTGMVGYPAFIQANVLVYALYNPNVEMLGQIEVKSDLTPANGIWTVNRLEYELESQVPNGKWFMLMEGVINQQTVAG